MFVRQLKDHQHLHAGTAFGGWIGGYVGDKAALWSPHHGRILACQLSVFAGVPLSLVILKVGLSDSWLISNRPLEHGFIRGHAIDQRSTHLVLSWSWQADC